MEVSIQTKILTLKKKELYFNMKYILPVLLITMFVSCYKTQYKIGIPSVYILSGPGDNDTLYQDSVSFIWAGNDNAVEYNYSMDGISYGWTEDTSHTFLLDEGYHVFMLVSRNEIGEVSKDTVLVHFYVDALRQPGFWIKHRYTEIDKDSTFSITIFGKNIHNMGIGYFLVKWNPAFIVYKSDNLDSSISYRANCVYVSKHGIDSLIVYIGVANDSLSGDFPLFTMDFLAGSEGVDTIYIKDMDIRDDENHPLEIKAENPEGIIVVR